MCGDDLLFVVCALSGFGLCQGMQAFFFFYFNFFFEKKKRGEEGKQKRRMKRCKLNLHFNSFV